MEKTNRDFKGIWIPRKVWLNKDFSLTEKNLIAEIDSLDTGNGCWASNEYLAKFCEVTEGRLANMLTALRKKGYILDRKFDGRKRYISINWNNQNVKETLTQGSRNSEGRVHEIVKAESEILAGNGLTEPQKEIQTPSINTINNTYTSEIRISRESDSSVNKDLKVPARIFTYSDTDSDGLPRESRVSPRKKSDTPHALEVFALFGKVPRNWLENKTERVCAENLFVERGIDGIKSALKFCQENREEKFFPSINSPWDLDSKWAKLIEYKEKNG